MMKKLINKKETFLTDMLEGLLIAHPELDLIANTVIVKKAKKEHGVAIVSGGGSGHEPAHAGFVAEGMLDAAVCGEVFTSPTPDKILEAIKAVDTGDGVLLVVKNYAGDVDIIPIGGLPDGSIGTSFDIIQEVLTKLEDDALCFYDIGSSEMNVDMAIEMYDGNHRVLKVDAPIVEGSFIAAVKLSIGGSIDDALAEIKQSF
ncbi:TPA: PTS-dependent dihydroxyacetone kinase phosphotransferase subunit DhaM [Staphylococcus aureus]|nr:PTS-dependent dihydroxyacetone kinase phosphotransferase subunit DhaM [Staphylococcus aureus]HCW7890090.1 PTS-dependent dihydroxyacetone kinase phosphotransferase subunit DhaM [Staphylococcus aureus]